MGDRSWLLRWPIAISLFIIIALLPDDAQRGEKFPSMTLGQMVSINDASYDDNGAGWSRGGGGGGVRIVEAKMKKVRKKKQGKPLIRPQAMFVLKWLFICLFLPPVLFFVYSLVRDPITPHIIAELGQRLRERSSAYLGSETAKTR